METAALSQPEKSLDRDSLFLTSLIFRDMYRTLSGVQMIAALLLQYAMIGASITNSMIDLAMLHPSEEN